MIRTQITKLEDLAGCTIERATWCDTLDGGAVILLLLYGDQFATIMPIYGHYPGDDLHLSLRRAEMSQLAQFELGIVDEAGLEEIKHRAQIEEDRRVRTERDRDLTTLARLKEKYE